MPLSNRLAAIAKLIKNGDIIADIGTDHALLPVFLLENGTCPHVIACDINEGPLAVARKNTHGVSGIELRLGDGLSPISAGEVDCAVIAGMGGEIIAQIIEKSDISKEIRFILQPMSSVDDLRKFLSENGFFVTHESVVKDASRLYVIICAQYGGENGCYEDFELFIGKLRGKTEYEREYIMSEYERIKKLCADIKNVERKKELYEHSKKCLDKIEKIVGDFRHESI